MPAIPDLATCKKIGFIVPSSNTAVEPITQAIFQSLNSNIICIFTRIQVKTTGVDTSSTSQFSTETMVTAARLLADAEPDAILWNGTSGMWVEGGLEADKRLAAAMQDATSIPCSTTTLATLEALELCKPTSIGVAVPYGAEHTKKVQGFFAGLNLGYSVVHASRMDPSPEPNIKIAKSSMHEIRRLIVEAGCAGKSEAVVVACTNWPGAGLVNELEKEMKATIIDSVIVTVWQGLRMAGFKGQMTGWGRLMGEML